MSTERREIRCWGLTWSVTFYGATRQQVHRLMRFMKRPMVYFEYWPMTARLLALLLGAVMALGPMPALADYDAQDGAALPWDGRLLTTAYVATGQPMANGHYPRVGDMACPEWLSFGEIVQIEGIGRRVCGDRHAKWLSPRFDVFVVRLEDAWRVTAERRYRVLERKESQPEG